MPVRTDIKRIMILGSGPIVIGQACEFDYSGTQACKALRDLGFEVILLNSNPATIMTDPEMADITYIEPLTLTFAEKIIAKEKPDALLPTVGGQTALNLAIDLYKAGILAKHNVELIGADVEAIELAEDRQKFKSCMLEHGLPVAPSGIAHSLTEAFGILDDVGLPAIIRPSFTLGGEGGGVAYNIDEYHQIVARGLQLSPTHQVLIEKSALKWKEFEFEVMRDKADNVIIICSIENFDPMGVHTGDSITVAPAQTLTDREYQELRDVSLAVIRAVGVETGGSNIQFAVHPDSGEYFIIEMNPRVSRSSALASKATGFPIAKIAAQLAVGLLLNEIPNDITQKTPACFEPALDYVVVKIPRWNFEKFPGSTPLLGTQMKAVGEVMSLGSSFQEALCKAISSLEGGFKSSAHLSNAEIQEELAHPTPDRLAALFEAFKRKWSLEQCYALTGIDRWFLYEVQDLIDTLYELKLPLDSEQLLKAKSRGIPDSWLSSALDLSLDKIQALRQSFNINRVYKRVDTCAAEFESFTPYLYSSYGIENESGTSQSERVIVLGNGPNRIGQGIEFDYCCCHAAMAVRKAGYTAVMVNCNPETVSTDYDTSDKLYFEPIDHEHVRAILEEEKPIGTILQFGGQTPLKLSHNIKSILGTSADAIDLCEDRKRFNELMTDLNIQQPAGAMVFSKEEAFEAAEDMGFPLLVRPSYVLGGRAMEICASTSTFSQALDQALEVSESHPVLLDRFLEGAIEYDLDALCDGTDVWIAGIMEHIEEAGVHSGDSSCILPPLYLSEDHKKELEHTAKLIGKKLGVIGLMNIQFAIYQDEIYVLEVNPRASRTVPYLSKAIGIPLAQKATYLALGSRLSDLDLHSNLDTDLFYIKSPVFPWQRFTIDDVTLGPEMRSTGEVMGIGATVGEAYAKAMLGAGLKLPKEGTVFLSFRDQDKDMLGHVAQELVSLGYSLVATTGTHKKLNELKIPSKQINKVREGRPDIVDAIRNGDIQLMINTPSDHKSLEDESRMRIAGLRFGLPCITTLRAALVLIKALRTLKEETIPVRAIQNLYKSRASR
ncbi:MAG: carbamoyl phosphate synthase large subunit [Proteobacteria bacterium]|nr:carbamoyl phosphate synthase large subunit [Pseudomonadota bacterium]